LATWINTPAALFGGNRSLALRARPSYPWGWLGGILFYELLLGAVAGVLHPIAVIFLAVGPFAFIIGVTRPILVYGLFILSVQFSDISLGQIGPFQVRVVDVGFLLVFGLFLLKGLSEKKLTIPKIGFDSALWFFLAWIALSFAWTLDRNVGFEALIKIGIGVLTLYMSVSLISGRRQLDMAINIWILAGLISAGAAIYEFQTVAMYHIQPGMTKWATPVRSQGFFGGPIMLGSFLTLSICINYGLIVKATSMGKKMLWLMTAGIMAIGLLTTLSRNDIAAFFLVTAFFNYRFKQVRVPTGIGVVVVLLIGLVLTGGKLFSVFWERFFYVFQGLEVSSQMRVDIWRLALNTILAHPLHGVGLGGFPAIAAAAEKYGSLVYPHSMILYVMVEFGFIGFALVANMALRIFVLVRRAEKRLVTHSDKAIGSAMTAGLIVHLFWTLSQNITFQHIIFWVFSGIAFGAFHVLTAPVPGKDPRTATPARGGGR